MTETPSVSSLAPTPEPAPTADQILNLIIHSLFDLPENCQISTPMESITKRINTLKAGFVPPDLMVAHRHSLSVLDNILVSVFGEHAREVDVATIMQHFEKKCPKYSPVSGDLPDPEHNDDDYPNGM